MPTLAPAAAAIQHTLDVAQIFKENSVIKQGLPEKPARIVVGEEALQKETAAAASTPAAPPTANHWPWATTAAVAAGSALLGSGLPSLLASLWPANSPAVPAVKPATADVSLLQDLQERGYHLPPAPVVEGLPK